MDEQVSASVRNWPGNIGGWPIQDAVDFRARLFKVHNAIATIKKDAKNPFLKNTFVSLNAAMEVIRPLLLAEGIYIAQGSRWVDDHVEIYTILTDSRSTQSETHYVAMALKEVNPQGLGSALTYGKRYSLLSAFGLVGEEDDDGNQGTFTQNDFASQIKNLGKVKK